MVLNSLWLDLNFKKLINFILAKGCQGLAGGQRARARDGPGLESTGIKAAGSITIFFFSNHMIILLLSKNFSFF